MKIELRRLDYTDGGTLGRVSVDGRHVCFTVERPWRDNAPHVSCIPVGTYPLAWTDSPKFGRSLEIREVPNRSHILFHAGNRIQDCQGCVLPAEQVSCDPQNMLCGITSRGALQRLEEELGSLKRGAVIRVTNAPPGGSV